MLVREQGSMRAKNRNKQNFLSFSRISSLSLTNSKCDSETGQPINEFAKDRDHQKRDTET